ncbi:MAG TPA: efflux RND transporter periplasmic adaptor subunit [Pirellulales bacterium]|nr:efflux RND transporter periplasmic adaptor subunit [Pirellulales bacterium]
MSCPSLGRIAQRSLVPAWLAPLLALAAVAFGCREPEIQFKTSSGAPAVRVVHPELRDITRIVGQPSFVQSYERTSIYPKMTAYIENWIVDIGDTVKKGDVLANLFVPELVEDLGTKKATVELDKQRVDLALKLVEVAAADVEAAKARLEEAEAILADYQAQVDRWNVQVARLQRETDRGVVDPQVLLESRNQLKSSAAARDKAQATIAKAKAELLSEQANLGKANVDVGVARADLAVATSEVKRLEAWVGYLKLYAPFDGVIVSRNANTGDFVLPATGDPTAMRESPHLSPSGSAAPIYVVDRLDVVRVFVDVPESDADYVDQGTSANVLIRAYRDEEIPASVTRVSWSLNTTSRTLRAEIDLHNPDAKIRPGMYAYGKLKLERQGVRSLPLEAIEYSGDQTFCWLYQQERAVRTEIATGISDGDNIEVLRHRTASSDSDSEKQAAWVAFDGSERVILGDLSQLIDGEKVRTDSGQPAKNDPTSTASKGKTD